MHSKPCALTALNKKSSIISLNSRVLLSQMNPLVALLVLQAQSLPNTAPSTLPPAVRFAVAEIPQRVVPHIIRNPPGCLERVCMRLEANRPNTAKYGLGLFAVILAMVQLPPLLVAQYTQSRKDAKRE